MSHIITKQVHSFTIYMYINLEILSAYTVFLDLHQTVNLHGYVFNVCGVMINCDDHTCHQVVFAL